MTTKIFVLALVFISALHANAQSNLVKELAPGVFYYYGDEEQQKSANCTWIVFKDYVLAIDANYPWGAEEIVEEIKKTTNKPVRFVFNTHYHHDHTFGNANFVDAGAIVVSTAKTAEEMHTLGQYEWDHGYSPRDMKGYRREYPTLLFNDTIVFDDSTHRVELIRMGPAHTAGDGVAYLPKEKILVTGDLFAIGIPWGNNVADPHADYDKWIKVLATMESWKPRIIIPGHGEPSTTKQLKDQRLYLSDMLKQVRSGIRDGKSKQQIIQQVNLSKHPVYGENTVSIKRSVGDMYDNLTKKKNSKN
jgi:cyclase